MSRTFLIGMGLVLVTGVLLTLHTCTNVFTLPPASDIHSSSARGEWSMFRHDPQRTATTSRHDVDPRGHLRWTAPTGGPVHSSPAVAHGTVFVGSRRNPARRRVTSGAHRSGIE